MNGIQGVEPHDRRDEIVEGGDYNNEDTDSGEDNPNAVEEGHDGADSPHEDVDADGGNDEGQARPRRTLLEECERRPFLDGRFFRVDLQNSAIDGYILAECVTCPDGKMIKGSLAASSNFTTHLRRAHPVAFENYRAYKVAKRLQLRNEDPLQRPRIRVVCTFSQHQFETNVSNYVLESMAPLSTVEMPAFRKMFDDLEIKRNDVPLRHLTRRTLYRRIEDIHGTNMNQLRRIIDTNAKFVCTTADIWTSRNRRFLGVTVHWIDEETLLRKSAAIACRRFPGIHSSANIARCLIEIHESFHLTIPKLHATVTDNGANFVKAFRDFGVDLPDLFFYETIPEIAESGDEEDSPDENQSAAALENRALLTTEDEEFGVGLPQHLRCASHTLNLIATTDSIKMIRDSVQLAPIHAEAVGRCTSLWRALRSPRNSEIMRQQLGVALLRPVVTRWNSLYDAMKQILSLKVRILNVSAVLGIRNPLTDNDFVYLQEYLLCMGPIAEAIDRLQGETYCYYGYLLPTLVATRRKLLLLQENRGIQNCRPLLEALVSALERRFHSLFTIEGPGQNAAIAAVTHPKFKTRWLACLEAANQEKVRNLVLRAAKEVAAQQNQAEPMEEEDDYFDFGQPAGSQEAVAIFGHGEAEVEYLRYTNRPTTDLAMLKDFPIIRSLFIKYNTPMPSSAPVERLFSFATMMNLPRYNRLTDAHFEQRVLSKANAKRHYL